jgi:hypothetical protein
MEACEMKGLKLQPFCHTLCGAYDIPEPTAEYKFHPDRKFKFDYAFIEQKIAVEIEGGIFPFVDKRGAYHKHGAHGSISGILRDMEKYNLAAVLGWRILRYQPGKINYLQIQEVLK